MNKEDTFPKINKAISASLVENLRYYTKPYLLEVANQLNIQVKKSWKKEALVTELAEAIEKQFSQFYKPVVEDILSQFGDQVEQALGFQNAEQIEVLSPLINKGFFFVYQQEEGLILVIPDEIWSTLWVDEEVEEISFEIDGHLLDTHQTRNESNTNYEILKEWKANALKIYGHASTVYFATVWNKYYDEKLTAEQIDQIINQ